MLSDLSVQQVIAICGSLAGIIVALVRYRSIKHDNKIDAFKINHELISKSRFIYSEEALKAYYEYEKKCFVKSSKKKSLSNIKRFLDRSHGFRQNCSY